MSDINLLENQLQADGNIKVKKILSSVQTGLIILLVLFLAGGVTLMFLNKAAQKSQANAAKDIESRRDKLEETSVAKRDKVVGIQGQIMSGSQLLVDHVYWTKVFEKFNSASVTGVRFTDFTGAKDGQISISAVAPDLTTIASYSKKLQTIKGVTNVVLNSSALSGDDSNAYFKFTATITFDPAILKFE